MGSFKAILETREKEWHVIRGAPFAFFSLLLLASTLIVGGMQWHYSGEEKLLSSAISNKDSENEILKEELKGLSPELAAMQARRAKGRIFLLNAFVQAGAFLRQTYTFNNQGRSIDTAARTRIESQVNAWDFATAAFIESQLGAAAKERYLDDSIQVPCGGIDQIIAEIARLMCLRQKSLAVLIETAAYDK